MVALALALAVCVVVLLSTAITAVVVVSNSRSGSRRTADSNKGFTVGGLDELTFRRDGPALGPGVVAREVLLPGRSGTERMMVRRRLLLRGGHPFHLL